MRSRTDLISLLILFFLLFLMGWPLQKSLRLHRLKSDWDKNWQECYSSKYPFTGGVEFQNGGHDVISCNKVLLPGEWKRSLWSSVRQFLIYSTFILDIIITATKYQCASSYKRNHRPGKHLEQYSHHTYQMTDPQIRTSHPPSWSHRPERCVAARQHQFAVSCSRLPAVDELLPRPLRCRSAPVSPDIQHI